MIVAPHPLDTHNTSSLYILKVFDVLYTWLVAICIWLQLNTVIAYLFHSMEHISDHYDMVEAGDNSGISSARTKVVPIASG